MLEVAQKLCRNLSGSQCSVPKLSSWGLVTPSQSSIGVDIADVATGGAAAVIPVNVKAYGSYFLSGLERDSSQGGMSSQMQGLGAGVGLGAGWGVPFIGAKGTGSMQKGITRKVLEAVGSTAQGKITDLAKDLAWPGISGGTRLIAGPDSNGDLSTQDFHNSYVTIISLGANFIVNGISFGMIIVSKQRPVLEHSDMIYARAIGLMGGVGLATSMDLEASGMVYRVGFL